MAIEIDRRISCLYIIASVFSRSSFIWLSLAAEVVADRSWR
jgi:hypothetical protein